MQIAFTLIISESIFLHKVWEIYVCPDFTLSSKALVLDNLTTGVLLEFDVDKLASVRIGILMTPEGVLDASFEDAVVVGGGLADEVPNLFRLKGAGMLCLSDSSDSD